MTSAAPSPRYMFTGPGEANGKIYNALKSDTADARDYIVTMISEPFECSGGSGMIWRGHLSKFNKCFKPV